MPVWLVLSPCGRAGFDPVRAPGGGIVANVAFVTSTTPVPGALRSLAKAAPTCAARAPGGGLAGTFVAWLSTSAEVAFMRVAGARGWVRTDGRIVADTVDDLIYGNMVYPIRLDEHGRDIGTSTPPAATGTYVDQMNTNCND